MEKFCQIACLAKLIFQLNLLLEKECCWKWKWTVQLCPQWRGCFSELAYSFSLKKPDSGFRTFGHQAHRVQNLVFENGVDLVHDLAVQQHCFSDVFFLLSVNLFFSEIWSANQSTSGAPSRRELKQESLRRRKITFFIFLSVFYRTSENGIF